MEMIRAGWLQLDRSVSHATDPDARGAAPELPLGELASDQRIEQGDESGPTQNEWLPRLNLFNQRHPEHR